MNQNFSALADALDVTVPNSFANSGIADANEVNANFQAPLVRNTVLDGPVEQPTHGASIRASGRHFDWNEISTSCARVSILTACVRLGPIRVARREVL